MESVKETNGDFVKKMLPKNFHFLELASGEDDTLAQKRMRGRGRNPVLGAMLMLVAVFFVVRMINEGRGDAAKREEEEAPEASATTPMDSVKLSFSNDEEAAIISLIQARSPSTTFDNAKSPQRRALDWLLSDEFLFKVSLFNDGDRIVQRFALAVIYYGNGGDSEWSHYGSRGWLSPHTECYWGIQLFCNPSLSQVTSYTVHMDFEDYSFRGSLPREFGLLSHLTHLYLHRNDITGAIPSEIGLLTELDTFMIVSEKLEGPLPTEIGMLSQLTSLFLQGNKNLTGRVPTELANLSNLEDMSLFGTQLTGSIPFPCDYMKHNSQLFVDCDKISCGGCCFLGC